MISLKGKIAVITGGSKGIGKAIAADLVKEGCHVVISARNDVELHRAAQALSQQSTAEVFPLVCDVTQTRDVENLVRKTEEKFGAAADFLVNNAGIGRFAEIVHMDENDFRAVIETNLFGVFFATKAFLPGMISKGGGHVVNISSLAGKNNFATGAAYCASKHALLSFAECLMLEVRHHNIKVSTICPGSVQTDFGHPGERDRSWALSSEDVSNAVLDVLTTSRGSLISLVDLRPLKPKK
jgi:NAD(P)-dependent dehydrogenase (short-subunit alcohol dehydrogenase family)